jgi:hypothetical protein
VVAAKVNHSVEEQGFDVPNVAADKPELVQHVDDNHTAVRVF